MEEDIVAKLFVVAKNKHNHPETIQAANDTLRIHHMGDERVVEYFRKKRYDEILLNRVNFLKSRPVK